MPVSPVCDKPVLFEQPNNLSHFYPHTGILPSAEANKWNLQINPIETQLSLNLSFDETFIMIIYFFKYDFEYENPRLRLRVRLRVRRFK